jgi:hypothetical protein
MLALATAEIVLRCLSPLQLGFAYQDGKFSHPAEFVFDETSNARGYHDVEVPPRDPNVRRIVLLGDSYVEARMLQLAETPGRRLEYCLNERSDRRYEVIALGGRGWGQSEELAAFRRHGAALTPDVVITLFLSFNDVKDNHMPLRLQGRRWDRENRHRRPDMTSMKADDAPLFLLRGSLVNQLLSHRLSYLLSDRTVAGIPSAYFIYARTDNELWRDAWRQTERLVVETKQAVEQIGARYVMVAASTPHGVLGADEGLKRLTDAYPGMKELAWDLDAPDRRMQQFCEQAGIPFLALEPLFRTETAKGRRLHYKYDGHWNAAGADLAGQLIADFVLKLEESGEAARP